MPSYAVRDDNGNTVQIADTCRQAVKVADWLTKTTLHLHHVAPINAESARCAR